MLKVLSHQQSLIHDFLAELRNVEIQQDRARFRRNVERIGEVMAYEISMHLSRFEGRFAHALWPVKLF